MNNKIKDSAPAETGLTDEDRKTVEAFRYRYGQFTEHQIRTELLAIIDRLTSSPVSATTSDESADARAARHGEFLFQKARESGWKDDGEGAFEFIVRKAYETGFNEASRDPEESVAWRWRSIFNEHNWSLGVEKPEITNDQYIVEPLYRGVSPRALDVDALNDLILFWKGRSQALRALYAAASPAARYDATLRQAETYETATSELAAAISNMGK